MIGDKIYWKRVVIS
jgi:hypothetical protein